ncbi:MAG: tetratricopeptide repeat protein, partial [Planctomycetaceae bacterium]|nr:tetratricopeptide repeat protein [Planctomycetaceae bacterium]
MITFFIDLLEKYFNECLDDKHHRSIALALRGQIYYNMGKYDLALENYKSTLDFEKIFPQSTTDVYLSYSELVIQLNRTDLFKKVIALLLDLFSNLKIHQRNKKP